jgi:hypothetical protein
MPAVQSEREVGVLPSSSCAHAPPSWRTDSGKSAKLSHPSSFSLFLHSFAPGVFYREEKERLEEERRNRDLELSASPALTALYARRTGGQARGRRERKLDREDRHIFSALPPLDPGLYHLLPRCWLTVWRNYLRCEVPLHLSLVLPSFLSSWSSPGVHSAGKEAVDLPVIFH